MTSTKWVPFIFTTLNTSGVSEWDLSEKDDSDMIHTARISYSPELTLIVIVTRSDTKHIDSDAVIGIPWWSSNWEYHEVWLYLEVWQETVWSSSSESTGAPSRERRKPSLVVRAITWSHWSVEVVLSKILISRQKSAKVCGQLAHGGKTHALRSFVSGQVSRAFSAG